MWVIFEDYEVNTDFLQANPVILEFCWSRIPLLFVHVFLICNHCTISCQINTHYVSYALIPMLKELRF